MKLPLDRFDLKRYLVSVASVTIAGGVTAAIEPLFNGKAPLFFFIAASVLSAAYGGLSPGLFATGLGVGVILSFFHTEVLVLSAAHSSLIVFIVLGAGISLIMGHLRKVNAELAIGKDRLETANVRLLERTQALSQANEELQRFAYALAHDLSSPLRGISALTELLVQRNAETFDESSKECAGMIVGKVKRTLSMIKGLLDYAAAGEKPEERTLVDCNEIVRRAMDDLDSTIKDCGGQITVGPLPLVAATDSHLVQVFSNLISNALKYRPSLRQPRIHISSNDQPGEWVFCVSDNGIGLDMKYADEVFGMFRRLHGGEQYEGNGIGLALCKMIIQRHGGRIWVESEIGKGSRFYFTLPKRGNPLDAG
jgi:signal transduction histidine kinase